MYVAIMSMSKSLSCDMSCRQWSGSPTTTGPQTIYGKLCCYRWSPGPTMATMDGPLCHKWSPCRKPAHGGDKSWLATPFNNNTMHGRLLQKQIVNE